MQKKLLHPDIKKLWRTVNKLIEQYESYEDDTTESFSPAHLRKLYVIEESILKASSIEASQKDEKTGLFTLGPIAQTPLELQAQIMQYYLRKSEQR